ncbi:MAG: DNA adenine methylase [Chloroflexota bacterium]
MSQVKQRSDYTFKYNQKLDRHGWLRLTPAYSVKLVEELVQQTKMEQTDYVCVLDPFAGTATTGLVAANEGFDVHLFDINPFLIWLGDAKCANYDPDIISNLRLATAHILENYKPLLDARNWQPKIYKIERWWSRPTLKILAAIRQTIINEVGNVDLGNPNALIWIAFCRLAIETSAAAFNHVSMSFQEETAVHATQTIDILFSAILNDIFNSAAIPIAGDVQLSLCDSRQIQPNGANYTHVITSPPYPNRISYIRELRPYMYWTGFLREAKEAGELDWEAIGGTWGVATSRLKEWQPTRDDLPDKLHIVCEQIANSDNKKALLMSQYVKKYFHDMHDHFDALRHSLAPTARLRYIVGNSTFYGVHVNTEQIFQLILEALGYQNINCHIVRKRNSKKELFEYCVAATWNN